MKTYIDEKTGIKMCCADSGPEIDWIVTAVEPRIDRTLLVTFVTGEKKVFDMNELIGQGGVFARLKDDKLFMKAHTDGTTVVWDEMLDIAPESLYERGVAESFWYK